MIMEPCVALKEKKKPMYLSHCLQTFTVLQTSVEARPVRDVFMCVRVFLFNAFPQRLLPKQKRSLNTWGELLHIQLRGGVCVV